jgi:hypothetical protein
MVGMPRNGRLCRGLITFGAVLGLLVLSVQSAAGKLGQTGARRVVSTQKAVTGAVRGQPGKARCLATVRRRSGTLSFSSLATAPGGLVSLRVRPRHEALTVSQSPACSTTVLAGRSYRASLIYRSTGGPLSLQVLTHTKHGWSVWYTIARLKPASHTRSFSATVRAAPRGVDRLALALRLGGGTLKSGHFTLKAIAIPAKKALPTAPVSAPSTTSPSSTPESIGPGSWSVLESPVGARSVHAILLQNGKVLIMAGSGNSRMEFEAGQFKSYLYDPVGNEWTSLTTPKDVFCSGHVQLADGNVLILGGTSKYPEPPQPGHPPSTEYDGENASWIFNIRDDKYHPVEYDKEHPSQPAEPGPLLSGTWYPSATELGNGDVISFGGLNEHGQGVTATDYFSGPGNPGTDGDEAERWVGFGSSKLQQTYDWFWGLYPSMILTEDGRLFYDGSHVFGDGLDNVERNPLHEPGVLSPTDQAPTGSSIYDFYCTPGKTQTEEEQEQNHTNPNAVVEGPNGTFKRITSTPGLRVPDMRDQSASLLLPPAQAQKVMIMGGGNTYDTETDATDLTDEIDLKEASPHWVPGPDLPRGKLEDGTMEPMGAGKMYVSAVALPDGNVLETGGSLIPRTKNVLEASIFDPTTNAFTSVAPDPVGRDYHSEALLLPDGRVLALGSNPANDQTGEESFETRISIYTPAYLEKPSQRPVLSQVDGLANSAEGSITKTAQWEYGTSHTLGYSSPSSKISSAVLIRPAAMTHSSDPNQREVDLPITEDQNGQLTVGLTSKDTLAPPGYYMVFLVDAEGVPSKAQWVHVGPQGAPGP